MKGVQYLLFFLALFFFACFYYQKTNQKNFFEEKADVIVFSYHRPMQLYAFLESLSTHGKNCGNVFVVYRSEKLRFDRGYDLVKKKFKNVQFVKQSRFNPGKEFKDVVMDLVFNPTRSKSKYICFAVDDLLIKESIDFDEAIEFLQTSKAYGFFFRLGKEISYCYMLQLKHTIPPLTFFKDKCFMFEFEKGNGDWNYPNNLDMTLYRKKDIHRDLKKIQFSYPNDFEAAWDGCRDDKKTGICYQNSKIVNLPLNIISKANNRNMRAYSIEELLILFEEGYKFDLSNISEMNNNSVHFEYLPTMILR